MTSESPNIIYRKRSGLFRYQAWPTVCRTKDGTLYVVCSGERAWHICPFGKNLMFVSHDNGDSWSPPMLINDTWLDDRDAGICVADNGDLILSWFNRETDYYLHHRGWIEKTVAEPDRSVMAAMFDRYPYFTDEMNCHGSFTKRSKDGGKTWSAARRSPVTSPHGPIQARDGRLLWLGKEMDSDLPQKDAILLAESRDGGESWSILSEIMPPPCGKQALHEPYLIELTDGTLLGAIRAQGDAVYHGFTMYFCRSEDGGKTFTKPEASNISGSPPHLLQLRDGRVLCTYGRREEPFGIRAVISTDGGKHFGEEMELERVETLGYAGDLGYPSTVELDDGTLLTVWYEIIEDDPAPSIVYKKWQLKKEATT